MPAGSAADRAQGEDGLPRRGDADVDGRNDSAVMLTPMVDRASATRTRADLGRVRGGFRDGRSGGRGPAGIRDACG